MDSYGAHVIGSWVRTVLAGEADRAIWTALGDRLRLTLAQGWVLQTCGLLGDDLAEDLADEETANSQFGTMLEYLADMWRSTYADLRGDFGVSIERSLLVSTWACRPGEL